MTGLFRQKSAVSVVILLLYAIVLKLKLFISPQGPLLQPEDAPLYKSLLRLLMSARVPAFVYSLLVFALFFVQAVLINRIANLQKMFPRVNYLPAMSYILITSLWPEWNQFSSTLLVNTILLWTFYQMLSLYDTDNILSVIYNSGLIIGFSTLVYKPVILFSGLFIFSLFILRPFILREWIVGLLGIATPFYFLAIYLFLTDQWSSSFFDPGLHFAMPQMPVSVADTLSLFWIVFVFMIGGFYMQGKLNKMLIQARKNWSLTLVYLIIGVTAIFLQTGGRFQSWLLCCVPLSLFHGAAYFYPERKFFPAFLQWLLFSYALFMNFWG